MSMATASSPLPSGYNRVLYSEARLNVTGSPAGICERSRNRTTRLLDMRMMAYAAATIGHIVPVVDGPA